MDKRDIRISSSLDHDVTHTEQDISISVHIKSHNPHIKKKKIYEYCNLSATGTPGPQVKDRFTK